MMIPRRCLLGMFVSSLLIIGIVPGIVHADITGNTYDFHAVWFSQLYQVDGEVVLEESYQGNMHIHVYNITPSDRYEYTFEGMNFHPYGFSPYYDKQNDSVAFQDNKVYFDLDTTDEDENGFAEAYDIDLFPYFSEHHPGDMFFVNPVWSTHNTDWNSAVSDAEAQSGVSDVTASSSDGVFSFRIVISAEQTHSVYGYLNGTLTLSFDASYDTDGVLSTWSLEQVLSLSNVNHTVTHTISQAFSRGVGGNVVADPALNATVLAIALAGIGGLVLGVILGKRY